MKIWQCYEGLAAQQWYYTDDNRIAVEGQGHLSFKVLESSLIAYRSVFGPHQRQSHERKSCSNVVMHGEQCESGMDSERYTTSHTAVTTRTAHTSKWKQREVPRRPCRRSCQWHPCANVCLPVRRDSSSHKNDRMPARRSYDCNGTPAQSWNLERGSTKVRLDGTDFCLDAGSSMSRDSLAAGL